MISSSYSTNWQAHSTPGKCSELMEGCVSMSMWMSQHYSKGFTTCNFLKDFQHIPILDLKKKKKEGSSTPPLWPLKSSSILRKTPKIEHLFSTSVKCRSILPLNRLSWTMRAFLLEFLLKICKTTSTSSSTQCQLKWYLWNLTIHILLSRKTSFITFQKVCKINNWSNFFFNFFYHN